MSRLLALTLSLAIAVLSALPRAYAEPPTRVGRVSFVDGAMTVFSSADSQITDAPVNYPVAEGMRFTTPAGSRSELELGNITVRLDGNTDLAITALDDQTAALNLIKGSIDMRVRVLFDGEHIAVRTSDGQIAVTQPGAVRIDAPRHGPRNDVTSVPTHLAVFTGTVRLESRHGTDDVFSSEAVDINSADGTLRYGRAETTWLDDWALSREQDIAGATSDQYVASDTPGVADLDQAGTWDQTDDYGAVWYPQDVSSDWEPYRYGSWTWVAPWGWTWVDDQPWGFAPFHYGRWVHVHGRWGWSPGATHRRPIYAPALVAFIGDSDHSRHRQPHGWVPLAPGEHYTPPYSHNDAYMHRINVGNEDHRPWNGNRRGSDHQPNEHGGGAGYVNGGALTTTSGHQPPSERGGGHGRWPNQPGGTAGDETHQPPGSGGPITITDDTFKHDRRPGPENRGGNPMHITNPSGVTPQPFVTPPPATAGEAPSPVTPMTTNPAGSYGQGAWRNDPRGGQQFRPPSPVMTNPTGQPDTAPTVSDQQFRNRGQFRQNPGQQNPDSFQMRQPTIPQPITPPAPVQPIDPPQIRPPEISQPRVNVPETRQPYTPPAGNPFGGNARFPAPNTFSPPPQPIQPMTAPPTQIQPAPVQPAPSGNAPWHGMTRGGYMGGPNMGGGNLGQGNIGQGNTGQGNH